MKKLSTEDMLMTRGFPFASTCRLCRSHVKTHDHFVVECHSNHFLWLSLASVFGCSINLSTISDLITSAFTMKINPYIFSWWSSPFLFVIWTISFVCNVAVFEDTYIPTHSALSHVLVSVHVVVLLLVLCSILRQICLLCVSWKFQEIHKRLFDLSWFIGICLYQTGVSKYWWSFFTFLGFSWLCVDFHDM